jgi:hypothetical protein
LSASQPHAQTVLAQSHRYLLAVFGGAQGLRVKLNEPYFIVIDFGVFKFSIGFHIELSILNAG